MSVSRPDAGHLRRAAIRERTATGGRPTTARARLSTTYLPTRAGLAGGMWRGTLELRCAAHRRRRSDARAQRKRRWRGARRYEERANPFEFKRADRHIALFALAGDCMLFSRPHPPAFVAGNDALLIGERAATHGRIATEGDGAQAGAMRDHPFELQLREADRTAGTTTRLAAVRPTDAGAPKPTPRPAFRQPCSSGEINLRCRIPRVKRIRESRYIENGFAAADLWRPAAVGATGPIGETAVTS